MLRNVLTRYVALFPTGVHPSFRSHHTGTKPVSEGCMIFHLQQYSVGTLEVATAQEGKPLAQGSQRLEHNAPRSYGLWCWERL